MWFYIDMSHCEWAVCGYEDFLVLFSLLYVGLVWFTIRLKYITVAAGRWSSPVGRKCVHGWVRFTTDPVSSRVGRAGGYSTYQHKAITSRCRQLLMMGTWLPEMAAEDECTNIRNTSSSK